MRIKTQADLVEEELGSRPQENTVTLTIPGIKTLHQKPTAEIAEVLANVLRSRSGITKIEYVLGSHIKLTVV